MFGSMRPRTRSTIGMLSPRHLGFACVAAVVSMLGCTTEPAHTETPKSQPQERAQAQPITRRLASKQSNALDVGLRLSSAARAEERGEAERILRESIDGSSQLLFLEPGAEPSRRHVELVLDVGVFEATDNGIRREVVLVGTTQDGSCQIFRLASRVSRAGSRVADEEDRALLIAGVRDVFAKLEGIAPRVTEDATCVDTGDKL